MGITQLGTVKALPYVFSNALSLLTCFPLAVAVIALASFRPVSFKNGFLTWLGSISYEVYLIHAFTLALLAGNVGNIFLFAILTVILAWGFHWMIKRGLKHG